MTGDDFLEFAAATINVTRPTEAACRSAISRAYYGVFHLATAFLASLGFQPGGRHDALWKYLQISNHPRAAEVGNRLSSLYTQRRRADYQLETSKWGEQSHAARWMEQAAAIAKMLAECESTKDEIRQGIAASLQKLGGRLP
jgi:uncharacterized protein (UPF0332 family)